MELNAYLKLASTIEAASAALDGRVAGASSSLAIQQALSLRQELALASQMTWELITKSTPLNGDTQSDFDQTWAGLEASCKDLRAPLDDERLQKALTSVHENLDLTMSILGPWPPRVTPTD